MGATATGGRGRIHHRLTQNYDKTSLLIIPYLLFILISYFEVTIKYFIELSPSLILSFTVSSGFS
ncbi:protein of unknown function [Georgfuchsia toluolica]|uniref:Uncharacterized protein n=1 Tax=Georgfuchsia toluolica TaxID=424218 RepID=A0A916NIW7_9PROT|nr:protein of unknown function [Georgfuchsia toluolica]